MKILIPCGFTSERAIITDLKSKLKNMCNITKLKLFRTRLLIDISVKIISDDGSQKNYALAQFKYLLNRDKIKLKIRNKK